MAYQEIDYYINSLTCTAEDDWMKAWLKEHPKIEESPHYLYLLGDPIPMMAWMKFRNLPVSYLSKRLIEVLRDISLVGQTEPIQIYGDGRIVNGHKRVAVMAFLGHQTIRVIIVSDNTKL